MQRTNITIKLKNSSLFKQKLLQWAQKFKTVAWLDSNNYNQKHSSFEAVLAVGSYKKIEVNYTNAFEKLKDFQAKTNDYTFGYFGYDLKNDIENLSSNNFDGLHFSDLFFFQPKKIFFIKKTTVEICYLTAFKNDIETDIDTIFNTKLNTFHPKAKNIKIKLRIHKDEYHTKITSILNHIHRGDIYEANFCQEFYSENSTIHPLSVYQQLNEISKPPFATFLKINSKFLLSASPERYIQKKGNTVISQPIKGTAKRSATFEEDKHLMKSLAENPKERAENIMIVDLVRNDLSHIAIKGSVKVEELCQVYTFEQVHQLISTVSCQVKKNVHPVDILKNSFPMGSMTGAPKISAMKIIEELEETKRGLYSGAVGYFTPQGNFDFNVIIRSILYNASKNYVSYSVGGAITAHSIIENEYEECLLKAKAMKQVLLNTK